MLVVLWSAGGIILSKGMSSHTGFANPSPGLPTHMSAARGLSRGSGCRGGHPFLYTHHARLGNPSPGLPAHMSTAEGLSRGSGLSFLHLCLVSASPERTFHCSSSGLSNPFRFSNGAIQPLFLTSQVTLKEVLKAPLGFVLRELVHPVLVWFRV